MFRNFHLSRRLLVKQQLSCLHKPSTTIFQFKAIHYTRNIGIVAHIDAGKTTTSEQMLYLCGETSTVGRVDSGDTVMDFLPQERERGITISAAAISLKWKKYNINLIDTPGHVDFTVEVERSARVLDGSVIIVDAVSGVQAQTRTVWKQVKKQNLPTIAFVNKMDRSGADFNRAIQSLRDKLGANAVPIQYPLGSEDSFVGVVDLISMHTLTWSDQQSRTPDKPVREAMDNSHPLFERVAAQRTALLEAVAELDEPFMDRYFGSENGSDLTQTEILAALRRVCLQGTLIPTVLGASLRGKGVEPLLDSVLAFLPSPVDRPGQQLKHLTTGESKQIGASSPALCAFAFKVVVDEKRGPLVYARVFSGTLSTKQTLHNSTQNHKERINQLLHVSADDLDTVATCGPGDICCLVGLKHTATGDTLVDERSPLQSFVLDGLTVPKPVFSLAIEPEKSSQQDALESALTVLTTEDPSLTVDVDAESGLTMLRGIGELHLEIVCDTLKQRFKLPVTTGNAYVAYRETLSPDFVLTAQNNSFTYDRTVGQKRMFAKVVFEVTASGAELLSEPTHSSEPGVKASLSAEEFHNLQDALGGALSRGPRGFPVVGVHVHVKDVIRDSDTTPGAIRACVAMFVDKLLRSEGRQVLEPLMSMELELPPHCAGDVLNDLTARRRAEVGEINSLDAHKHTISATVPLATILGYASTLRSMTQGEGSFTVEYCRHAALFDEGLLA